MCIVYEVVVYGSRYVCVKCLDVVSYLAGGASHSMGEAEMKDQLSSTTISLSFFLFFFSRRLLLLLRSHPRGLVTDTFL